VPGHPVVPEPDGDGFLELDENGVPLGTWEWNPDTDEWEFDDIPPPLAPQEADPSTQPASQVPQTYDGMPKTGDNETDGGWMTSLGFSMIALGMILKYTHRRHSLKNRQK
jgi:hypothetical protein